MLNSYNKTKAFEITWIFLGLLDDTKHCVGWCEFCEPQQYLFEFVGVRSSPTTYIELK